MVSDWKRQRREGVLADGSRTPGGRGGPSYAEVDRLRRENRRLQDDLTKAKFDPLASARRSRAVLTNP